MANYKNILLKDAQGNALLPITLSYYVEYRNGVSVQAYLDTLSSSTVSSDEFNEYKTNLSNSLNNSLNNIVGYFSSYVTKPDWASYIGFDNSSYLTDLEAIGENDFVTVQQAIEALDQQISTSYENLRTELTNSYADLSGRISGLEGRLDTTENDIDTLEGKVETLEDNSEKYETAYELVKALYTEDGTKLAINADAVSFTPSGSTNILSTAYNVGDAIDALETKVNAIDGSISEALVSTVSSVSSSTPETIRVKGIGDGPSKNGAVSVGLNLANDGKLTYNNGLTIDETKLDMTNVITYASNIEGKIQTSQIEGGLGADNINITYSYTEGDTVHNDGEKTVQEFYNEYITKIDELEAATYTETLDNKYNVTLTDDLGANTSYARVYTLSQAGKSIGTINIPKDQFLRSVEYSYAQDGTTPALVFHWQLPNAEADTDDTTYVPITEFIDAITGSVNEKVNELETDVENLQTSVSTIENSYITGATIDGQAVNVVDHVLQLSYVALYTEGTSSESISQAFLESHGITLS